MCVKHKKTPSSEASGTVLPWNMPMYSIGDYAKYLGVTPDFLKHYEQFRIVSSKPRENGYRYYLTVDGIGAGDLADTQTVSVGGATYRFSALSLAKAVIEGNYGEEFKDLMKALVLYADAVSAL